MYDYCVIGGTGAIGGAIAKRLSTVGDVAILNSKNCNLLDPHLQLPDFKSNVVVNASGTFGGLLQYESGAILSESVYLNNLTKLIGKLSPNYLVNISSAALSNSMNLQESSVYKKYADEKLKVEDMLNRCFEGRVGNLRCTNIISQYENYLRSGHSVASIYRKFLEANGTVDIWSNEQDWREYIDADDVAIIVSTMINKELVGTYTVGSGEKIFIREIANKIASLTYFNGNIKYTQPHKKGPLSALVGIPPEFAPLLNTTFPANFYKSVEKCVLSWQQANL